MAKKQPKYETTIDGLRGRVYASRSEYEVLIGDGDIADPAADVWAFPKIGEPTMWAEQAVLNHKAHAGS